MAHAIQLDPSLSTVERLLVATHPYSSQRAGTLLTVLMRHWSNEDAMVEYIEKVLAPFMDEQRQKRQLHRDSFGLAIFDLFAAHRTDKILRKMEEHNIKQVFVLGE